MKTTTTHEQILLTLYNETNEVDTSEFMLQLLINAELYEEYYNFKEIKNKLDDCMLAPKANVVKKILDYASY